MRECGLPFKTVSTLANKHAGQSAWIFGKGPGLDLFDQSDAGTLRICINESLFRVDSPSYFFAHDEVPIERVSKRWPLGCLAILEPARGAFAASCGIPEDDIWVYQKVDLAGGPGHIVDRRSPVLVGKTGTVHSAIDFCRLVGANEVVLVGFEGRGGYASSLGLDVPIGGGRHDIIRHDSEKLLQTLGLKYRFLEFDNECKNRIP